MSFDPVTHCWSVPWFVKALYLGAVIGVIVLLVSGSRRIGRSRGRASEPFGARRTAIGYSLFIVGLLVCGALTVGYRVQTRRLIPTLIRSADDAEAVRRILGAEERRDEIVGLVAVACAAASWRLSHCGTALGVT